MNRKDLCKWLEENSSGIYRPAKEAAFEIEHLERLLLYSANCFDLAYRALEDGLYDEAMLHCGHCFAKINKELNEI